MFMGVEHWAQEEAVTGSVDWTALLLEGAHGRHQYLARNCRSAPPVKCSHWLKNINTQLQHSLTRGSRDRV